MIKIHIVASHRLLTEDLVAEMNAQWMEEWRVVRSCRPLADFLGLDFLEEVKGVEDEKESCAFQLHSVPEKSTETELYDDIPASRLSYGPAQVSIFGGWLTMLMDRDLYEKLGLNGRPARCSPEKYFVRVDMRQPAFMPGRPLHKRVLDCITGRFPKGCPFVIMMRRTCALSGKTIFRRHFTI